MVRDQASSAASGGGETGRQGERPETGDAGRGDDPWRRVESESANRADYFKKQDLEHGPSAEFEQAARPPARDAGRDREMSAEDFTANQRAELEEAHGRSLEDILASREQARVAASARTDAPPAALEHRADLPDDDVYNHVIGAYNRGEIAYNDAINRIAYLDASPVHSKPRPEASEQEQVGESTSEQTDQDSPDDAVTAGGDDGGDDGDDGEGGDNGDGLAQPPDGPGEEPDDELSEIAEGLRSGALTREQAVERLETYREQREADTPEPTETTDVVREEGDQRLEHGTATENRENFGEKVATEESDKVSRLERKIDAGARAAGAEITNLKNLTNDAQSAWTANRLPPGSRGETTVYQDVRTPNVGQPQEQSPDAGNVIAASLTILTTGVVLAQRWRNRSSEPRQGS